MMSRCIVVVGTSLGGLNALSIVLTGIPSDFSAPIAIAQHRSRDADSTLVDLLQRKTQLPISEADDKMPIESGHVYLAPPDYHLLIGSEQLSLSTEGPVSNARPSVDVLFDSAASSFGAGVIAVVLTGASEDGAEGAAAVKRRGGLIIAQEPKEAESPIMPMAVISRNLADAVLPLRAIARELEQAARGRAARS